MKRDFSCVTVRDFKNGFQKSRINENYLVAHQRAIYDVWSRLKELKIHRKELAKHLYAIWEVDANYAGSISTNDLLCPRSWEIRAHSSQMKTRSSKNKTSGEIDSQRMSDLLHFLGYREEESRKVFTHLNALSEDYSFKNPDSRVKVHHKAVNLLKSRIYENSLDSMEGLGEFAW